jgi:hypothetical protein
LRQGGELSFQPLRLSTSGLDSACRTARREAKEAYVLFDFQEDLRGLPMQHVAYQLQDDDFETSESLDCTIVGVAASCDELRRWGAVNIETTQELSESASVSIIQHPERQLQAH